MLTKQGKQSAWERVSRTIITVDEKPAQANGVGGFVNATVDSQEVILARP